jgi:hypothetical protein
MIKIMKKKIPYGISNFAKLSKENLYYIDKTHFIPIIEDESDFLYFLRPRRFGKSLTIAMLEQYYDINCTDTFESVFKDTYILSNPTPKKNSYHIMRFDFSAVDITDYERSFRNHISLRLNSFVDKYDLNIKLEFDNPIDNMEKVLEYCFKNSISIYLLIDEYDNFVTKLLIDDMEKYKNIVTSKSAIYKEFFSMLKVGTTMSIDKMFITGVSPLALYDVTSGSNIGVNISINEQFNDLVGITKKELLEMIDYYNLNDKKKRIIEICNKWYNSYVFSKNIDYTIYNSDMILYYINHLIRYNREPEDLIDTNVRTDYSKLKYLIYSNKKLNGNFQMLNNLIEGKDVIVNGIKDNFSAFELTNADNFKSFMFSLGFMTMRKYRVALKLSIPNETIKKLLAEFIHYAYRDFSDYSMKVDLVNEYLMNLGYDKDLKVFYYLNEVLKESSSVRDYIDGENFIKAYLISYLSLNNFYMLQSEKEINKGFADLVLDPVKPEVPFGVILEIKYIKKNEFNDKLLQEKITQAKAQLTQYDLGEKYIKIVLVYHSWELVHCKIIKEKLS